MPVLDNPARILEVADAIALEMNATIAVKNESDSSTIAASFLLDDILVSSLVMPVASATDFPDAPFIVGCDSEDLLVTAIDATNWTITRGYNGTTPAHHAINAAVTYKRFFAARIDSVDYKNADLATLHVDVRDTGWELQAESHGGSEDLYQIEIAVQKMAADQTARDVLKLLTGRIARYFCPKRILGVYGNVTANQVQVIESVIQPVAPDKIKQGRYFGLVTLTLREFVNR